MNVIFEHSVIVFDNHIAEVLIGFVNHILFVDHEDGLRRIVTYYANKYGLNRYFLYGFGNHHLWLKQRVTPDNTRTFAQRILIVKF